jgi:hypothetical protein
MIFVLAGRAAAQSNPHTQIAWPANCDDSNFMTYNVLSNTCFNAGSTKRPIAPLANVSRPASSSATGAAMPQQVIAFLGNSLVAGDTGSTTEFCNEAGIASTNGLGPLFMAGHQCRPATNITVDSSNNVTLAVNNADGYFQNGTRFTAYGGAGVDGGCLYDSYIVTSATTTQIVFPSAPNTPCAPLASTPVVANNVLLTTSLQRFGQNGGSLDSWFSTVGNWTFSGYKTWIQGAIAAGQTPITIMRDAGIMTNSTRMSAMDYRAWMADLMPVIAAIQGISATNPAGETVYVSSLPFYIDTGNPEACNTAMTASSTAPCSGGQNTGAGGVYVPPVQMPAGVQYVFPYGTPGSQFTTPATITSGAISAGANTVTINPCPPDLWGGPGDVIPTALDSNGLLRSHGNLIQMVVDSAASAAQELVSLTAIIPTGATGLHNWQTCQVSFTAAFAHAANAPIYATQFTADQTWVRWKLQIPYDVAAAYPGHIEVIDTLTAMGRQVANPGWWIGNELHPGLGGYAKIGNREFTALASYQLAPKPPPTPDPLAFDYATHQVSLRTGAIDINFDLDAATAARALALGHNCGMYYNKCDIDPAMFYPSALSPTMTFTHGTQFARMTMAIQSGQNLSGDGQTGDFLYTSVGGSWQPTTLTAMGFVPASLLGFNFTGTPPVDMSGRGAIMRPFYADPLQGAKFAAHPISYPLNGTYNLKVGTSTTNNLVFSIPVAQNPAVIGGQTLTCLQIEMQAGDWIVTAGNIPGSQATAAGVSIQLPTGSWNPLTCTWTDTSGTNYSVYNGVMATLVQQFRAPDATFSLVTAQQKIQTQALTALQGVQSPGTPTVIGVVGGAFTSATTGGNCANGTAYTLGLAYMPLGWGTDYTHAGAIRTVYAVYTPTTGTTTDVVGINITTAAPFGYTTVAYLLIGGTYYAFGKAPSTGAGVITTTCPATGAGLIVANTYDNGSVGFVGPAFSSSAPQTTVNCSTSGTAIFAQTQTGSSEKKVLVYLAACSGTASYTFPVPFTHSPSVFGSDDVAASIVTAKSTTAVTVTGAPSTGALVLDSF